jgi:hypothetical protein
MDTDENELHPEQDTPADSLPSADEADDEGLQIDDLAGFSAVADETVLAVDTLYGGMPPMEDEYEEEVDSSLAVASVSDVTAEREAEREFVLPAFEPSLPMPPMTTLRRGQLGSLAPALLLIGIGAWLTLTTTAGTPPDGLLVAAVVIGAFVVTLLAQWIGSGRWGRGYLFFAVLILLVAGLFAYSLQPGGISLVRGWPLLMLALGIAVVLSGILARPVNRRMITPGLLLVIAGLLGTIVVNDVLPARLLTTAILWAPAVFIVLVLIWLLPLLFRRRG